MQYVEVEPFRHVQGGESLTLQQPWAVRGDRFQPCVPSVANGGWTTKIRVACLRRGRGP